MLHLPTSSARPSDSAVTGRRPDRAMDVLQYGVALFVILVAAFLGLVR